ncbi:hypothetical protein ACFTAO_39135 [Paenibacillus rhizoplanae]
MEGKGCLEIQVSGITGLWRSFLQQRQEKVCCRLILSLLVIFRAQCIPQRNAVWFKPQSSVDQFEIAAGFIFLR